MPEPLNVQMSGGAMPPIGTRVHIFSRTAQQWHAGEVVAVDEEYLRVTVEYKVAGQQRRKALSVGHHNLFLAVVLRAHILLS